MSLTTVFVLRAVLAVIRSTGNHVAFTSPNPAPTANERRVYHRVGADAECSDRWDAMMLQAAAFVKISIHAIDAIELTSILFAAIHSPLQPFYSTHLISHPELGVAETVGSLLIGVGGVLRVVAYRAMGPNFTFELAIRKDHTLITHGPYSIVRHPSYTAGIITLLGMMLAFIGPGGLFESLELWSATCARYWAVALVLASVYICGIGIRRTKMEDRALRGEFKGKWVAWSNDVPYKLIPYIY